MEHAHHILREVYGYDEFRHSQAGAIETLLAGGDALVLMPTGGGKSLCYQIPALIRPGTGIVISPLIALMQDQVAALAQLGIRAAYINSSQDYAERQWVEQALLNGELDLLYVAPERLLNEAMLDLLDRVPLALFAIDEAHCVSQWGHDFRKDYQRLRVLHERYPRTPRIALTATADVRTRQEIIEQLDLHRAGLYLDSFDRPNIRYAVAESYSPMEQLWRFLQREHPGHAGIVYCLSRKRVEQVAAWLSAKGRHALPYHAGLPDETRRQNQETFLREEAVVIVATIAFGMGIDKPDVRFVAHLNMPKSVEAYYQETGRAGRDGQPADAWMAYSLQDVIQLRQMMLDGEGEDWFKRIVSHKLEAMLGYCEMTSCRRQTLLAYFGEIQHRPCGNCDNCLSPPQTWDATESAQKALSCVYRTGQRFGVNYLIDVLLGKADERIRRNRHDQVSTFGIGKELDGDQWRGLFRRLIATGHLGIDPDGHGALQLSDTSRPLLRGEERLTMPKRVKEEKPAKGQKKEASGQARAVDQPLFEALRARRTELAREQGVPPYVIFHDSVLQDLARRRPGDRKTMALISGVGGGKLERYGDSFMQVIRQHPLPGLLDNSLSDTINATLALHLQGLDAQAIAVRRELSLNTVHGHFAEAIAAGLLEVRQVLTIAEEDYRAIVEAIGHLSACEEGRLKPLFDFFEGAYSYGVLRCVAAEVC
ncbi:MAG: ATP-dependent DNA helicase RecQ [Gammaproteobacteria bacterium RIFOXYA12_FULL_61_12]|nr:MAG: ATP-dependent DNA helicase RecQ [Gammaproteobacteria bacterium RIFOXYA12_FULL_61_12]OGT89654.1 MAG: ATP-dependent DNA helicase RecQ [Gammaproteobacteria bacterium RIFOXYD12_FULL_61_37]